MKKLLLLLVLLMSPVYAVNWEMIETDLPNLELYADANSLIYINDDECYYAIRYKNGNKPEKIAYLKSNSKTNYIGVIQTADYGIDEYKPLTVFRNAHVFMKPVTQESFLSYAHEYVTTRQNSESVVQDTPSLRENNVKPVSNILSGKVKDYTTKTALSLYENWEPPVSGRNTKAVTVITIGIDGSLQNYGFLTSSGDEATDRSIISAIEKTAPFAKFPRNAADTEPSNFQFVFDYKFLKKSVY